MPKKFIPSPELLATILTRYKETKNYSLVSRETGLTAAVVKRIIDENKEAPKNQFTYIGPAPVEPAAPQLKKIPYYYELTLLMKEHLNV